MSGGVMVVVGRLVAGSKARMAGCSVQYVLLTFGAISEEELEE
jgi:hypothetical protein